MEDYRSKSYGDGRTSDLQPYSAHRRSDGPDSFSGNGGGMQDLRSYSTSYTEYPTRIPEDPNPNQKKGRSSSSSSSWGGFVDPDLQRKKRVVSYRAYTVEGKLKGSFRKSFKWIKDKCNKLLN
ncbi:hypothetical protein CARUB_v10014938mg [Capsella rubella]|uniref:DUF3511 domain-containing protein n=1 Tax=Capsella rubella TaxID=81985 RepID=R0I1F5_9BRAS|nr:uncharacterized protein LOC17892373 [Capsella rubella]EOA31730.1 hypothetical protein CARUB_v10014938mg [Capsella rubella]